MHVRLFSIDAVCMHPLLVSVYLSIHIPHRPLPQIIVI